MAKVKITNHQLFSLTAAASFGGTIIVLGAVIVSISKQDAWISILITSIVSLPIICLYWFLGSQYPNMTFVGIIKELLGKWLGSFIAAIYVFLCIMSAYCVPWYVGNFLTTQTMPRTPLYVINSIYVLGAVIGTLYGLEAISRASEILMFTASILLIVAILLVLPNAKIENLQPICENGIGQIFKSVYFLVSYLTFPTIFIMMIYPINIDNISKAKKAIFKGYIFSCFLFFITLTSSILVLGSLITSRAQFTSYLLAKEIDIGTIFTRLEFIIFSVWFTTQFILDTLMFYGGIIGLSELLGLRSYKPIVIPMGIVVAIMSTIVFRNPIHQANFNIFGWAPYGTTCGLIIPVILFIVLKSKKWIHRQKLKK